MSAPVGVCWRQDTTLFGPLVVPSSSGLLSFTATMLLCWIEFNAVKHHHPVPDPAISTILFLIFDANMESMDL